MIEADEKLVGIEKKIVIRLLQGLRYGVQLALVRAGVIRLRLTRHRTYEVTVYAHGKADDVDGFLDVRLPITALFRVIDALNEDIMVLLAVGINTKGREPHLAGVLGTGEEVDNALLFLVDALQFLGGISDALSAEDALPVTFVDLYLVLDRGSVLKLGFLGGGDELLDVVPAGLEDGRVVRYRIIGIARGWDARNDGKLAFACAVLESGLEVGPRVVEIEERNVLDLVRQYRVLPVGKEYFFACAIGGSRCEAAVTCLLAEHGGDACAVL